ncbi:type II secretion system protein [Colwellia psychrerythraea]|uniref:MSHA biogenesis protein MshD n=1 Tax=Colwellia psychrerythraea TaxID=28229 RepID=A0A099KR22_COLPS|nr:type II secretion system protein [Colwellia psychrerythraea]KGJ92362.1 hypothetical protein GAB14E_0484 [Colwellia psychrerythraea]
MQSRNPQLGNHKGFTLIETIVGIVILAISFSVLTTLIHPVAQQSADQLHQVKAAELGQSVLNEIQNKAFDEKSDMAGGIVRCGENSTSCTPSSLLGPEDGSDGRDDNNEYTRDLYDDVDDYNGLTYDSDEIENSQGDKLDLYLGYKMIITVCNDANYDGTCSGDNKTAKLITVTITTPTDFSMSFSTYRANF